VVVERGGKRIGPLEVAPRWSPELGMHTIGVNCALDPEVREVSPKGAAARVGIREGERLAGLRLGGVEVSGAMSITYLSEYLSVHPGSPFEVGLSSAGNEAPRWVPVTLEKKPQPPAPAPVLGVGPHAVSVDS